MKVVIDGGIVGVGATIEHGDTAWLAHVIVHPNHRKKGIGGKLTKALIAAAKARNFQTILLDATDLGCPVYLRVGFEIVGEYVHFRKKEDTPILKPSIEIINYDPVFKNQVFELEKSVSNEEREVVFESYLADCQVVIVENEVRGVYFPTMYDGPIFTKNSTVGIELMKLRFQKFEYATVTKENKKALDFLRQNNFNEVRTSKRMCFGENRISNLENQYNRISGAKG